MSRMIEPGRSTRSRLRPIALLAGFFAVLVAISSGVTGSGTGLCAAPPPGWHPVVDVGPYLQHLVPPGVTFFVLAYVVLGIRSTRWRPVAMAGTLTLTLLLLTLPMPFSCGTWAP